MIQHVYERAKRARGLHAVLVATDDERIVAAVQKFGGEAILTSPDIRSGTDRVGDVASKFPADVYINIQGDEPLMSSEAIEKAADLVASGKFSMGTVMTPLTDPADLSNPAVVKVIADRNGRAIYFSRFGIPYTRGTVPQKGKKFACHRHVGLYSYTTETLHKILSLPSSPLEEGEMLEQLRAMDHGIPIGITEVNFTSIGVDTPEDLETVRRMLDKERDTHG